MVNVRYPMKKQRLSFSKLQVRKKRQLCSPAEATSPLIFRIDRGQHDNISNCVIDAYYVLSDPRRREQYDKARKTRTSTSKATWGHAEPDTVFGNVFEELLRPEVENPSSFYSPIGMASGAALGFICGGLPGAVMVK